jgi:hypothetical protein
MRPLHGLMMGVVLMAGLAACSSDSSSGTSPTSPTITVIPPPPTAVSSVSVSGPARLSGEGSIVQMQATVRLENGTIQDRTASASWSSSAAGIARVSGGLVTAVGEGEVVITATVGALSATSRLRVSFAPRTPDPAPGQRLPLPADILGTVSRINARQPTLMFSQSCPRGIKYVTSPWLDFIVDGLREIDSRWGYNAKPTKTAADNGGVPVVAAGDEIAYNYSANPDEGSTEVYLIDILLSHCGSPALTYRNFTGEEPGRWTGAGRF